MSNDFDLEQFRTLSGANGFIKHIEYKRQTVSTQTDAKFYIQNNGVSNALFVTDCQTEGHGRFNRSWSNTPGALTFSILFRPHISLSKVPLINYAAGLAMKELLLANKIAAELKWPNDIMVSCKKLCGILSESSSVLDTLFFVITGIGLNVNSATDDFPAKIKDSATSLKILTSKDFSKELLLAEFLPLFEKYIALIETAPKRFIQKYKKECNTLGKEVKLMSDGSDFVGFAEDINPDGSLLINKNGEKQSFFAADVTHLRNA